MTNVALCVRAPTVPAFPFQPPGSGRAESRNSVPGPVAPLTDRRAGDPERVFFLTAELHCYSENKRQYKENLCLDGDHEEGLEYSEIIAFMFVA